MKFIVYTSIFFLIIGCVSSRVTKEFEFSNFGKEQLFVVKPREDNKFFRYNYTTFFISLEGYVSDTVKVSLDNMEHTIDLIGEIDFFGQSNYSGDFGKSIKFLPAEIVEGKIKGFIEIL